MAQWLSILIGMILVNNYVLAQFLGICPFLGVSKKLDSAVGMGVAVTFVMVLATAATWPIMLVLNKFEIAYLQTIVFILVIAALVQFVEMVLKKFIPALHKSLGVYLPLITTNCAVLGVCMYQQHRRGLWLRSGSDQLSRRRRRLPARDGHLLRNETEAGRQYRCSRAVPGRSDHNDNCGYPVPCVHGIRRLSIRRRRKE